MIHCGLGSTEIWKVSTFATVIDMWSLVLMDHDDCSTCSALLQVLLGLAAMQAATSGRQQQKKVLMLFWVYGSQLVVGEVAQVRVLVPQQLLVVVRALMRSSRGCCRQPRRIFRTQSSGKSSKRRVASDPVVVWGACCYSCIE